MSESQGMKKTGIICPGSHFLLNDKNNPTIHYLLRDPNSPFQNLVCGLSGCNFLYQDKDEHDNWKEGFIPAVIPK